MKDRQSPTMTYMSRAQVPEADYYIELGWINGIPEPNPHIHEHVHNKFDEIVLHWGSDPENPEDPGAEIEFDIGGQQIIFDTTTGAYIPRGVKHGPMIWRKFTRPHIEMALPKPAWLPAPVTRATLSFNPRSIACPPLSCFGRIPLGPLLIFREEFSLST